MTLEEMKALAQKVADALNSSTAFEDATVLEDDIVPGQPIPVGFTDIETMETFVVGVEPM